MINSKFYKKATPFGKEKYMQNEKNKITELIEGSLESIKSMLDADTVIGTPIKTPQGTVIIPISKISVGFAGGGSDYAGKNSKPEKNNFGGAGGTGVSVSPIGFLVVDAEGKAEMLTVQNPTSKDIGSAVESICAKLPAIIEKFKETLDKKKKEKKEKKAAEKAEKVAAQTEQIVEAIADAVEKTEEENA